MLRWWTTLLWAVANLLIGMCAILPLGLAMTALGQTALFGVGNGDAGLAAGVVLVTLAVLGVLFVLVNVPFRRRLGGGGAAHAVWPAAVLLAFLPFSVALAFAG